MSPPMPRQEGRLTEWLLRCFALLLYGIAVANLAQAWWQDRSRWTLLLLLLTEGYTLLLVLLARRASTRDVSPLAMFATAYAVCFIVLLTARDTVRLAPEWVGIALQTVGMAWQFSSKIMLGRSFGLLPAQRTLVLAGPYRLIRHPIYFGYLLSHIGFLLANWSWRNFAILATLYAAQVVRIEREEAVLASDPAYRDYQARVRWKLLPGLY